MRRFPARRKETQKLQSFLRHRALTFFAVLAAAFGLGAALIACAQPLSTGQSLLIALAVAVVLALAAVTLLRHLYFGFHSSILLLPEELADELTPLSPIEQTRILAERYAKEHTELRCLANERFLSRLLDDNSHTHAIENIDERLRAILCKQFGYRYSTFCLVSIRVEDYDAYLLKNCNGHLLMDNFRRIYEAEEHASPQIALAAIKYADLSNALQKDYVFDPARMTATTGVRNASTMS